MCGRFTLTVTIEELMMRYYIDQQLPEPFQPRYNIAPTQMVLAVINDGVKNRLGYLKWGLIPSWANDEKTGHKMINARGETVADKPAFRKAFERKRCLIPADGFYEWKRMDEETKQPYRIILKDQNIFSFAGLYETWQHPNGTKISTCTIITTTPNELMSTLHARMPVILPKADEHCWLNHETPIQQLKELIAKYPSEQMQAYPVDKCVGNIKNDFPHLIAKALN